MRNSRGTCVGVLKPVARVEKLLHNRREKLRHRLDVVPALTKDGQIVHEHAMQRGVGQLEPTGVANAAAYLGCARATVGGDGGSPKVLGSTRKDLPLEPYNTTGDTLRSRLIFSLGVIPGMWATGRGMRPPNAVRFVVVRLPFVTGMFSLSRRESGGTRTSVSRAR